LGLIWNKSTGKLFRTLPWDIKTQYFVAQHTESLRQYGTNDVAALIWKVKPPLLQPQEAAQATKERTQEAAQATVEQTQQAAQATKDRTQEAAERTKETAQSATQRTKEATESSKVCCTCLFCVEVFGFASENQGIELLR
jgi:short-subunit dehydrogenase involved in D-alanine esterification of teichoic acids